MSWKFSQSSGQMHEPGGTLYASGWAGNGIGFNNPAQQRARGVGPLPQGKYRMVAWFDVKGHMGEGVIQLEPVDPTTQFGRSGFYIHGWALLDPLHSSDGCICIGATSTRLMIWRSSDHELEVVA